MTAAPAPRGRSERRGFALAFVLLLLLVASLTVGAALSRASTQRLAVQRALLAYQRHHEAFSVRAVVERWLARDASNRRLMAYAQSSSGQPVFRFEMPSTGTRIALRVADGQGAALEDIDALVGPLFDAYAALLSRIPLERVDLVRTVGEPQISLASAPREIFEALLPDPVRSRRLAAEALRLRRRDELTPTKLAELISRHGGPDVQAQQLAQLFTSNPTLWRLTIDAQDAVGQRRFEAYVEIVDSQPTIRRWLELPPSEPLSAEGASDA